MKTPFPRRSHCFGFALVEWVIVITILFLLVGSVVYLVVGFADDAKYREVESDLETLARHVKAYEKNNYFQPPTQEQGLRALVERPISDPQPERWRPYLDGPMLDPWGREYQYRFPARNSGEKYDVYSLGEDGVESDDDIGNW